MSTKPLTLADVMPPSEYEPKRVDWRRQIAESKRDRRIAIGDVIELVFENRETILGTVEEMLRAERIDQPDKIKSELDWFNQLLPQTDGQLCAVLYYQIADPADLSVKTEKLAGVEKNIRMHIAGETVSGVPDEAASTEGAAVVSFVRFDVSKLADRWTQSEVELVVDHPAYRAKATMTIAQRNALGADLGLSQ